MASRRTTVCVVGGGIAGLSAAFALEKKGVPYLLLEGSHQWGGVIRTERVEGFLLEGGPDSFLAAKRAGIDLCNEIGLSAALVSTNPSTRLVFVLRAGRLLPMPEGMLLGVPTKLWPFVRSRLMSWRGKLRMGLDVVIPPRRSTKEESISEFITRRFGREALERLGEPLLAGIHAGDPDRLSMRATFPRLVDLEARRGSLIRGLNDSTRPTGAAFYSLQGGLGQLVDGLLAQLNPANLRLLNRVGKIVGTPNGLLVESETSESVLARRVVLAVPPAAAGRILEALAPDEAACLAAIPSASTATVLLGYRREHVGHSLEGYGLVVPKSEGLRTAAVTFYSTKFEGRAPEGCVLLRIFVGGMRDAEALSLSDESLVRTVRKEMTPILGLIGEPVLVRVYRWPRSTPQICVGHLERIGAIVNSLASGLGVALCGAGVRVTGIPDSIAEGAQAAEDVSRSLGHSAENN